MLSVLLCMLNTNYEYELFFIVKFKNEEVKLHSKTITLLAPCLHSIPDELSVGDVEARHKQRYLDLLSNSHIKNTLITRYVLNE